MKFNVKNESEFVRREEPILITSFFLFLMYLYFSQKDYIHQCFFNKLVFIY